MLKKSFRVAIATFLATFLLRGECGQAEDVKLKNGKPVHFDGVARNKFSLKAGELSIEVQKSSSLWLIPFTRPKKAEKVTFEFEIDSSYLEENKVGSKTHKAQDDWVLRVGLLVFGEEPFVPFFAPSWVKAIRGLMKLPSDQILNITPSKKFSGQRWESPYAESILHIGVPYLSKGDVHQVSYRVPTKSQKIVGIWVQSDGDDLGRNFTLTLRRVRLN